MRYLSFWAGIVEAVAQNGDDKTFRKGVKEAYEKTLSKHNEFWTQKAVKLGLNYLNYKEVLDVLEAPLETELIKLYKLNEEGIQKTLPNKDVFEKMSVSASALNDKVYGILQEFPNLRDLPVKKK